MFMGRLTGCVPDLFLTAVISNYPAFPTYDINCIVKVQRKDGPGHEKRNVLVRFFGILKFKEFTGGA